MTDLTNHARLNMNPIPYTPWKGKTFNQITSAFKKNNIHFASDDRKDLFRARQLPIYRREIASQTITTGNPRTSSSIDLLNGPNGYSIVDSADNCKGLANTLDFSLTQNSYERANVCNTVDTCLSQENNAKRRVRSSGMIKKNYNASKNNDVYYTSSKQYMTSRNRTFQQNQYNYIRQGNSQAKPGDALSKQNLYSAQGLSHCSEYYISESSDNNTFEYQWVDGTYNVVTIPDGNYTIDEITELFITTMIDNGHYFIHKNTYAKVFLLNIAYNNYYKKIELQCNIANDTIFSLTNYSTPSGSSWFQCLPTDTNYLVPRFCITNDFSEAIGFTVGNYPSETITYGEPSFQGTPIYTSSQLNDGNGYTYTSAQLFTSTLTPKLFPMYVQVYYKPNNAQFSQQGAVSASSLITRLKYDTITSSASTFQSAFGKQVSNALAYGVPDGGYTLKMKTGFPLPQTPVFSKYNDDMKKCNVTTMKNG
jgi:hypothetical protein